MAIYLARRSGLPPKRVRLLPGVIPAEAVAGQATRFPLFCLAPHGVFHAPSVTLGAVSSYLAISPLPSDRSQEAVYFLRHYPSAETCAFRVPHFRRACCLVVSGLSSRQTSERR